MDKEELERLISKYLDDELEPTEQELLRDALDFDSEARRAAGEWERLQDILDEYTNSLGEPSKSVRQRVLALKKPRRIYARRLRAAAAIAALIMVTLAIGGLGGRLVWGPEAGTDVPLVDTSLLETAVSEAWQLMPSQVRWVALQRGKLQMETAPLPLSEGLEEMYLVSFLVQQGREAPRPLCQVAVLAGQEAQLSWYQHGEWSLRCRPVVTQRPGRLQVTISFRAEGATTGGLRLTSEPRLTTDGAFRVASSRLGGSELHIWAQVRARRVSKLVEQEML